MSYGVVEDFKGGLDRRRKRIAGVPGTLWTCENAHITRGGEIEKRKRWVPKYTLPAGTFGMESAGGALYVFGSASTPAGIPAGVTYQRLQHPDAVAMSAIVDTEVFDGTIYAIAEFTDGTIHHFYDGTVVADWNSGIVTAAMANNNGIAEHLKALIDADAAYTATRASAVVTITAAVAGTPFTIARETENVVGGTADQSITLAETVANVPGVSETLATARFRITGGTSNPGTNNLDSITVDGVEILNVAVDWATSNSVTAANIATQINTYNSTPEYTATSDGPEVIISAATGSGSTPNALAVVITVTGGNVTVDTNNTTMTGGVDAVSGQAQVYTATIGGTYEVGDKFSIEIDDKDFGFVGNPASKGEFAFTQKSKVYALAGSIAYFCAVDDPTAWNVADTGAGFQNMASQDSGSEALISVGKFQGNLVFFARRSAQVWYIDVDDSKNVHIQTLENTGTMAPLSVLGYGDSDLFYLSDSGIRSIRQVQGVSNVYVNDVGTAVDTIINAQVASLTAAEVAAAVAVIEPIDNRYLLTIDETSYVFSFFPSSKISAWSTYDNGAVFSRYTTILNKVYARSGDTIYLYGGDTGAVYDTDANDLYVVTIGTPFLTFGKVATDKFLTGFDVAVDGTWTIRLLHDPRNEARKTTLGTITNDTYTSEDLRASGLSPVYAVEMVCETPGYARIANFALHYEEVPRG
ncbi:MAG: hypothetical protein A3E78_12150 [Alphaproteobacteria bacterium RIFCSPHIGHO2_12_FULL_63_12]|nr:MAG: hypothetical protein A3E78_12150 [Alphaproteobacteria bacterium RIFCSPHIGHO2_12_FULL_63_12]